MSLSLSNCQVRADGRLLLDVPQIDFPTAQTSVIIGPNGAGKSTLIRQLLNPKMHAQWQGKPLQSALKQGRIAWVGQHETFQLPFTLLEYVLMGSYPRLAWHARPKPADHQQAHVLLEQFDLANLTHKRLETLSGGEKQRAAVARALLQSAQVLLLDEPTNHLDIRHQCGLMNHLRHLSEPRPTLIMVLHDLNLAAQYSDFAVLMKNGCIIAQGATADVMQSATLSDLYDWPIARNAEGQFQAVYQHQAESFAQPRI